MVSLSVEIIPTPSEKQSYESEMKIRDIKDRPILRAAIAANVDLIITGDKDFLSSGLTTPKIVTAAEFLSNEFPQQ
jgi:predicted nucleic acid-binding protein